MSDERDRDVAKWIAGFLDEMIRCGMDEDAHHRYRDRNSVESDELGEVKPITPPTGDEMLRMWESSSERVMRYLYPLVRLRLEEVVEDYTREDGR